MKQGGIFSYGIINFLAHPVPVTKVCRAASPVHSYILKAHEFIDRRAKDILRIAKDGKGLLNKHGSYIGYIRECKTVIEFRHDRKKARQSPITHCDCVLILMNYSLDAPASEVLGR